MDGISVPKPALRLTNGEPSVDATAIPPRFAVVSVEISTPLILVVIPSIISLSFTLSSLTARNAVVPPTVMFPPTKRLDPSKVKRFDPVAVLVLSL